MAKTDLYFSVHRSQLLPALSAAFEAVDTRAKIPILGNVLLKPEDGELRLRGTDLDIEIETTCDLLSEGSGMAITLKATDLRDIVRNLPETAEIEFHPGSYNGQVRIQAGRARFSIFSLPETDFPSISGALAGKRFEVAMPAFTSAIGKVAHAALKVDIGRPWMMGIYVHPMEDAKIGFAALNGIGLAAVQIRTETTLDFPAVIIPLKTATAIRKLFDDATEPAKIEIGENLMRVECGGVTIFSKLIDGIFEKNYLRAAPDDYEREIMVTVASMKAVVSRVCLVATEVGKDGVKLTLERGMMRVELYSREGESAVDYLPIEYEGDGGYSTGLNSKALEELLSSISSQDVIIRFGGNPPNAVFYPSVGSNELYVIAPMAARGVD
ncbi:MAG TPA: DNA polymerase III subunit beta [Rhizobium sp.]